MRFPWSRRPQEEAGQERLLLLPALRIVALTYRANIRALLPALFIVFAPIALLDAVLSDVEIDASELGTVKGVALLVGLLLNLVLSELGHELYVGIAGAQVMEYRGGHEHGLRDLLRSIPYGRLILADVIFAAGTGVGLLLLVVPGVLFFGWFVLSGAVIKIENRPLFASFGRARQLVRGNFWIVLLILGSIYLIEDVGTTLAESGTEWAFGHGLLSDWLHVLLVDLITAPLYAVAAVVLCLELIDIKGGAPNEEVARMAALSEPAAG